jgi:DNA repair protein RadD
MKLRDYQSRSVDDCRLSLAQGNRRPCLVLPTGAGKTVIAAHMIRAASAKGNNALFLAPRRELVYQTSEKLAAFGVEHGVMMAGEPSTMFPGVQVGCIPTMHRRCIQGNKPLPRADLVLVDEAHLSIARTTREIIDRYVDQGAVVIGLTATPCRSDGAGLGQIYDTLVEGPTIAELIAQGYLVRPRYFSGKAPDLDGVRVQAGDYNQRQLGERVNKVELVGDVVSNWARLAQGRPTIVFSVNVAHSMALAENFQAVGIRAEHVDGRTDNTERAEILKRLHSGETEVLCNCQVATYGLDIPPVSAIVLARPTKSVAAYFQMIGRGLRTFPGKSDCLVLDHAGSVANMGFVEQDMPWSLDGKEKVQDRISSKRSDPDPITCGDCGYTFPPERTCPNCGADQGQRYSKAIEAHEATLQEIGTGDSAPATMEEKRDFYGELKSIAVKHGYADGWIAHKYRAKFGVWPNGLKGEPPRPASIATQAWVRSQNIRFAKSRRAAS